MVYHKKYGLGNSVNKVIIDLPNVFRYDDVLDLESCKRLHDYIIATKGATKVYDPKLMPWEEGDKSQAHRVKDQELRKIIIDYRKKVTDLVRECYDTVCWPEQTDLVLWRAKRQHILHEDDPSKVKVFSTVTYLNTDFTGGETFITINDKKYWSKPRIGSIIIFPSNIIHGVPIIKQGLRTTLAMWFCTDIKHKEELELDYSN
jgi:hypothetical protein